MDSAKEKRKVDYSFYDGGLVTVKRNSFVSKSESTETVRAIMGIDIVTYRQIVGLFGYRNRVKSRITKHAYKPDTIRSDIHIRSFLMVLIIVATFGTGILLTISIFDSSPGIFSVNNICEVTTIVKSIDKCILGMTPSCYTRRQNIIKIIIDLSNIS